MCVLTSRLVVLPLCAFLGEEMALDADNGVLAGIISFAIAGGGGDFSFSSIDLLRLYEKRNL